MEKVLKDEIRNGFEPRTLCISLALGATIGIWPVFFTSAVNNRVVLKALNCMKSKFSYYFVFPFFLNSMHGLLLKFSSGDNTLGYEPHFH